MVIARHNAFSNNANEMLEHGSDDQFGNHAVAKCVMRPYTYDKEQYKDPSPGRTL